MSDRWASSLLQFDLHRLPRSWFNRCLTSGLKIKYINGFIVLFTIARKCVSTNAQYSSRKNRQTQNQTVQIIRAVEMPQNWNNNCLSLRLRMHSRICNIFAPEWIRKWPEMKNNIVFTSIGPIPFQPRANHSRSSCLSESCSSHSDPPYSIGAAFRLHSVRLVWNFWELKRHWQLGKLCHWI